MAKPLSLSRGASAAGAFDPKQFFQKGLAQLFGCFDLFDLLPVASLGENAPKLQTRAQDIPGGKLIIATIAFGAQITAATAAFDALQPSRALEAIWKLVRDANKYVDSSQPWVLARDPAVARALEGGLEELQRVGIDVEPFGGDAFAVKGAPALLSGVELPSLLADLAGQLADVERGSAVEEAFHGVLATMACHSAVRAHQDMVADEVRALLEALDAVDFRARCPHGRPVVFELSLAELERQVERR